MRVDVNDVRGMGIIISKLSAETSTSSVTSNRELSSWFQPKIGNAMKDGEDTISVALEVDVNENEGKSQCNPDDDDDDRIDDFDLPPPSQIHMSQVFHVFFDSFPDVLKVVSIRDYSH